MNLNVYQGGKRTTQKCKYDDPIVKLTKWKENDATRQLQFIEQKVLPITQILLQKNTPYVYSYKSPGSIISCMWIDLMFLLG